MYRVKLGDKKRDKKKRTEENKWDNLKTPLRNIIKPPTKSLMIYIVIPDRHLLLLTRYINWSAVTLR